MQNKTLVATAAPAERRGIGFIKSRKSDDKVMDLAEQMINGAAEHGIRIIDVIADQTSGIDIDRRNVDRLVAWMEKPYIDTVVLHSIFDISEDLDDLLAFLMRAEVVDVEVLSMTENFEVVSLPWDGDFLC